MKILSATLITFSTLLTCVSCNEYEMFGEEQYKKVIYVLSSDNNMVYAGIHNFDSAVSTGYITVYAGGTLPIDREVTVEFEKDLEILDKYNWKNFELDSSKYIKEMNPARYDIQEYSVTMKPGSEHAYALMPLKIHTEGLSPDSAYFIPLKIKSASAYEINPNRSSVLYRVYLENQYAQQKQQTIYAVRGDQIPPGKQPAAVTMNRQVYPLSKDKVRTFAGTVKNTTNINDINRYSIVLQINEDDKFITITPYNSTLMKVEQLGEPKDNWYGPDVIGTIRLYSHYRYCTRANEADEWGDWEVMKINMRRQQ